MEFYSGLICLQYLLFAKVISATYNVSADQDDDLLMIEEQFANILCGMCKKFMKKVKKHLGNHENAVSDKHP